MSQKILVLTLTGAAQQLSSSDGKWIESISIQPDGNNANPVYVGSDATVSSSNWGVRLPAADAGEPPPPWTPEANQEAAVTLKNIWVIGSNNEKIHVMYTYGKTRHLQTIA